MNILTNDREAPTTMYAGLPEGTYGNKRWSAELTGGPWYEDSNPISFALTEQEAVTKLMVQVVELRDDLNKFIESRTSKVATKLEQ